VEQNRITFSIPQPHYDQLLRHLLREGGCEEAAFVFCSCNQDDGGTQFQFIDWLPVPPDGFVARSPYYLEITDETRARALTGRFTRRRSLPVTSRDLKSSCHTSGGDSRNGLTPRW
jgi:hypothetical protein